MEADVAYAEEIIADRVANGNWAIDDAGRWHDLCASQSDFQHMADVDRQEFEHGSLFWFGMVFVSLGASVITVRWSVKDVDDSSLDAAIRFLMRLPKSRKVAVEYFFGGWERRMADSPQAAANMLDAAKRLRAVIPLVRPFVKRMPLMDIPSADPLIRHGFGAWERSGGLLTLGADLGMRNYVEHCLVFSPNDRPEDLIYQYLGRSAALTNFKGREWAASVVGKSCGRALENSSGDAALSDVYEDVMMKREPRYDHIRALIPRAGREVEWVSYQHLLTPMVDRRGRPVLLCLAVTTPDIKIPVPVQIPSNEEDPGG
jgi:hypothetical protein